MLLHKSAQVHNIMPARKYIIQVHRACCYLNIIVVALLQYYYSPNTGLLYYGYILMLDLQTCANSHALAHHALQQAMNTYVPIQIFKHSIPDNVYCKTLITNRQMNIAKNCG